MQEADSLQNQNPMPTATITNWYKEVYEPTYTTTPEKQG